MTTPTPISRAVLLAFLAFASLDANAQNPTGAVDNGTLADATNTAPATEQKLSVVSVTAKRLDDARNGLLPETGSSVYRITSEDIDAMPQGADTPLNRVLLQAPGVANDSYGQLHVRGDHADLQYRINGILIPEPISGFGQALDTRIIDHVNLLTGAL
ncbi:Plug domain-containing protein, partial [Burkholderia gladioli]|nr:Plug domain-containing protein [Burkholderia gladioli]